MIADQPLVIYPKSNEEENEPTRQDMDDLAERWAAKRKGSTMKGQEVNLADYLNNKI
nr:MAG TPA: hypothetical protein [Caudoviricetes sp.]